MPRTFGQASATGPPPEPSNLRYRPHLDGLRTVAVYLVVAFHAGLGLFEAGFIGVDIFFVLSGFLVTGILVRSLASGHGIRGRLFYSRRVRRILPAAFLTLVVTAVVYSILASPSQVLDALGGFKAAFLYVSNWYFIRQSNDYFAADVNANPVLQFWSLAIEEQFYLVWPVLLGGLVLATARVGRRRWWVVRSVVVVGGIASAALALQLARTDLSRAYYGTDTRAYQLLAGAALALTPQLLHLGNRAARTARWASTLALLGLVVLATSLVGLGPITRGVVVVALALVLLVAIENADGGPARNVLSSRPFVYLGTISYGVYLWHWPVIVVASLEWDLSPIELFGLSCVAATALAALSFRLLEQPIRASRRLSGLKVPVIAIGFAASIVFGLFVMPAILDPGSGSITAATGSAAASPGLRLLDWRDAKEDVPELPDCLGKPVDACTVVRGTGKQVLLMGDSNAQMWIPAFTEIAEQRGWHLSVASYPTCVWQQDLQVLYTTLAACQAHQRDWYARVVPKVDPDLLVLTHHSLDEPRNPLAFVTPDFDWLRPETPGFEAELQKRTETALTQLERPGREIVLIEPIPDAPPDTDPVACLSQGGAPSACSYRATVDPTPLELVYRKLGRRPGVTTIDTDRLVCPRWPTCAAIVGDIITKRDANHMTATYARSLAPQIGALLPR
jgi:peptidoglycan/LPS O-acetylase OafA/YrhL